MVIDDFLSKEERMIKEKYKQLFLSLQIGGIRTMNIHRCYHQFTDDDKKSL